VTPERKILIYKGIWRRENRGKIQLEIFVHSKFSDWYVAPAAQREYQILVYCSPGKIKETIEFEGNQK
jgi:hypothetical protein